MKTEFQNFLDMLNNAEINYIIGCYNGAGAVYISIGETEFYFTLDGELADVKGY